MWLLSLRAWTNHPHHYKHQTTQRPTPTPTQQGVVNRDIKLENTLLDSSPRPLVKICDFGYSKHEKFQSAPGSRVGTPAYLAPEVILTTRGKTYDGKVADIWSCGVMLYVMLVGAYPFERPEDKHDNQKLQKMIQVGRSDLFGRV